MKAMTPFRDEVEKQIAEATGGSTLGAEVAKNIALLLGTTPKTIKDYQAKIKILIDIGLLTGEIVKPSEKGKILDAQATEFKEVAPPLLGEQS